MQAKIYILNWRQDELSANVDRELPFTPVKFKYTATYLIIKYSLVIFAILVIGDSCFSKFDSIELQRCAVHPEHNLLTEWQALS